MPFFIVFGEQITDPLGPVDGVSVWDEAFESRDAALGAVRHPDPEMLLCFGADPEYLVVEASSGYEAAKQVLGPLPPLPPP